MPRSAVNLFAAMILSGVTSVMHLPGKNICESKPSGGIDPRSESGCSERDIDE
jgi:hypothetical protein